MIDPQRPAAPEELAGILRAAASDRKTIRLDGAGSKPRMAPPPPEADVFITTTAMRRVLQYEPGDLTISVEAGLPVRELDQLLATNNQMVPLDPPHFEQATVGGMIAMNACGPRRRLYGSARDLIIGMTFATVEGRLVQSGGMVVKNVAGLDMAKLMVGSRGTLAAIAVVNFKVLPRPEVERTYAASFGALAEGVAARNRLLGGFLQPAAIDLLNPAAAGLVGRSGYTLLVCAGGNRAVIDRYARELPDFEPVDEAAAERLWTSIREFVPGFAASHAAGCVVRASSTLQGIRDVLGSTDAPAVCRAGSGVSYLCFADADDGAAWAERAAGRGVRAVIECVPEGSSAGRWFHPGNDFAMMEKVKDVFDPHRLLNPGRLYGRL